MSFHHDNDARQPTILTFSCGCGRLLQCAHSSPLSLAISPTQPDQGPRLPPARACLLSCCAGFRTPEYRPEPDINPSNTAQPREAGRRSRASIAIRRFRRSVAGFADRGGVSPTANMPKRGQCPLGRRYPDSSYRAGCACRTELMARRLTSFGPKGDARSI
jgi:hypothetical protein